MGILILILFTLVYSVVDALNDKFQIENNQSYHTTGLVNRIIIFCSIGLLMFNPVPMRDNVDVLLIMFIGGSIYWIIFDFMLNIFRGKALFHRGNNIMDKLWIFKPVCLFLDIPFIMIFLNR